MPSNEDVLANLWPEVGDWQSQYAQSEGGAFSPRSEPITFISDDAFGEDLEDTKRKYKLLPDAVSGLAGKLGSLFGFGDESTLPDYEPTTQVQITESDRESWAQTIGEGALEGSGVGAMKTLVKPSVETAAHLAVDRPFPLSATAGGYGAAFASDNPYTAASYAGAESYNPRMAGGGFKGGVVPSGTIYPMRLEPDAVLEIPTEGPAKVPGRHVYGSHRDRPGSRSRGHREWPRGFTTKASELSEGTAQMVRGAIDPGGMESTRYDPQRFSDLPAEQWAYAEGAKVRPAGPGMTYAEVAQLGEDAANRLGIDLSDRPAHGVKTPKRYKLPLTDEDILAMTEPGTSDYDYSKGISDEDAERIIKEIENDPKFKGQKGKLLFRGIRAANPTFKAKLKRALKAGARGFREAFKLKNLATGAGQGAVVGSVSAATGRKAGELQTTQTGGTVTPPHPMYAQAGEEGIEHQTTLVERNKEKWRSHLLDIAVDELGVEGVEALLPRYNAAGRGIEDLRPSELMEALGVTDIDLKKPPPDTLADVAEEALAAEEARAESPKRKKVEPLYAPPKDPSIEARKTAWKEHPDWSDSEWRARVQDSWNTSFEKGGANAKAFIRNIRELRPDWSKEKVDRFYYEEVMPGVLDTVKNVKYIDSEKAHSYYARGLASLKSELGHDSYIDEHGYEITNLGMPPVGHPEQVGEIHIANKDSFDVISHEYSHAVNEAIEAILERSDDYSQGQYGDIGSDLLEWNRLAVKGAFPFIGTQELYGKTVESGGYVQHHYRYAELADNIRDIRRHLGRDPTADELKAWMGGVALTLTDDRGRGPGEFSEVGVDDFVLHYLPTPEETEERMRRGEGDRLEHPILDRETGLPIEGEEPWIENILDDPLREGTPSPEDLEEWMRMFSHYRPMTGALSRAFG